MKNQLLRYFFLLIPIVFSTSAHSAVYRCPGPPVVYTDEISEEEAIQRDCTDVEGGPFNEKRRAHQEKAARKASASCGQQEAAIRGAVKSGLKDPRSAQFGKCTLYKKENACMTVNAKNSLGGYTGEKQAHVSQMSGSWILVDIRDDTHQGCLILTYELDKSRK